MQVGANRFAINICDLKATQYKERSVVFRARTRIIPARGDGMSKKLAAACVVSLSFIFWSLPAFSVIDISGTWRASAMGAAIDLTIQQKGHRISGVAVVHNPNGKTNTYHFSGGIKGNRVTVAHHDGHRFAGSINSSGQLVGVLRTKNGHKVSVAASRR
jgi:hypothetical protein